jgi:hypothetical protein
MEVAHVFHVRITRGVWVPTTSVGTRRGAFPLGEAASGSFNDPFYTVI